MGQNNVEVCENCGCEIPLSEQAYIYDGKIVCANCSDELRKNVELHQLDNKPSQAEDCSDLSDKDIGQIIGLDDVGPVVAEVSVEHSSERSVQKKQETEDNSEVCFFCNNEVERGKTALIVPMFKVLQTKGHILGAIKKLGGGFSGFLPDKTITYHLREIKVPRCDKCEALHSRADKLTFRCILWFGGAGFVIGLCLGIITCSHSFWGIFAITCILLFAGLLIGLPVMILLKVIIPWPSKSEFAGKRYQVAKDLRKKGWQFGQKPEEKYGTRAVRICEKTGQPL